MSRMKSFAEKISIEMGYGGNLTPEVLKEANRILKNYGLDRHVIKNTNNLRPSSGDDEQ